MAGSFSSEYYQASVHSGFGYVGYHEYLKVPYNTRINVGRLIDSGGSST